MATTKSETGKLPTGPNIHQRLLAITKAAEVAKGGTAPQQVGGFAFHKIDDVEAVLKPLFHKHGVLALPTLKEPMEFSVAGGWNVATCHVEISFINADDPTDVVQVTFPGQGMDKQDKAAGKGLSYATKNAYLAVFHLKGQPDNEAESTDQHVPAQAVELPEVVPFGKNAGRAWSELSEKQLAWYANEATDPLVRRAAQREIADRTDRERQTISDDIDEILAPDEAPVAEELF